MGVCECVVRVTGPQGKRPPFSYAQLIAQALFGSKDHKATVRTQTAPHVHVLCVRVRVRVCDRLRACPMARQPLAPSVTVYPVPLCMRVHDLCGYRSHVCCKSPHSLREVCVRRA